MSSAPPGRPASMPGTDWNACSSVATRSRGSKATQGHEPGRLHPRPCLSRTRTPRSFGRYPHVHRGSTPSPATPRSAASATIPSELLGWVKTRSAFGSLFERRAHRHKARPHYPHGDRKPPANGRRGSRANHGGLITPHGDRKLCSSARTAGVSAALITPHGDRKLHARAQQRAYRVDSHYPSWGS